MSGIACRCGKGNRHAWRVLMRECNYSAFNGYRRTPSRYSCVVCLACCAAWRTKAAYVRGLPDDQGEWERALQNRSRQ